MFENNLKINTTIYGYIFEGFFTVKKIKIIS